MIPRQIHVSDTLISVDRFSHELTQFTASKPWGGGLWASSQCESYGSDWVRYMKDNYYRHKYECDVVVYEVKPLPNANIYVIDSEDARDLLYAKYGVRNSIYREYEFDWNAVAEDYDGVYLADWSLLDSWDCASSCWFNWEKITVREITEGEEVELIKQHIDEILCDYDGDYDDWR